MLRPDALPELHAALAALADPVDGWLIFDFRGINPIMEAVVGPEVVGSRRAYLYLPRDGKPIALVHAVDAELWREWPSVWRRIVWVRREELARELAALVGGRTVAMEYSPGGAVPYGDYVPAGTLELVRSAGARAGLVRGAGLALLLGVDAGGSGRSSSRGGHPLRDRARHAPANRRARGGQKSGGRARGHPLGARGVRPRRPVTESAPSISYGEHAARPHYEAPAQGSSPIVPGGLLLFDLWAREPGGIYADQTWMAAIGAPSARISELWNVVRGARDAALDLLRSRLEAGQPVAGAEADRAAYGVIEAAGYGDRIVCRTGHSIDRVGLHGYGPTLDDTESFDTRRILPGVGFSVEPGLYFPGELGLRSEVNGHARADGLDVTPADYQKELIVV